MAHYTLGELGGFPAHRRSAEISSFILEMTSCIAPKLSVPTALEVPFVSVPLFPPFPRLVRHFPLARGMRQTYSLVESAGRWMAPYPQACLQSRHPALHSNPSSTPHPVRHSRSQRKIKCLSL